MPLTYVFPYSFVRHSVCLKLTSDYVKILSSYCRWCGTCLWTMLILLGLYNASFERRIHWQRYLMTQITKFMGPTWGPPGPCRTQMSPMLAQWTLLSGKAYSLYWGFDYISPTASFIIMLPNDQGPNRHQAICNCHVDTTVKLSINIISYPIRILLGQSKVGTLLVSLSYVGLSSYNVNALLCS